jgi:hypothetical protein
MPLDEYHSGEGDHRGKVASGVQARQGVISGRVLTVLVVSLVLGAIALAVSYYFAH